jgi:hypothetical protein
MSPAAGPGKFQPPRYEGHDVEHKEERKMSPAKPPETPIKKGGWFRIRLPTLSWKQVTVPKPHMPHVKLQIREKIASLGMPASPKDAPAKEPKDGLEELGEDVRKKKGKRKDDDFMPPPASDIIVDD